MDILVHAPFLGDTGYNVHSQNFFGELGKLVNLKVINHTLGDENVLPEHQKQLLHNSIDTSNKTIVLAETNNHTFYQDIKGYKIAYNVWETTEYDETFFNRLLEFDELWVPTNWQRDNVIKQGYPKNKVFVVPEGVDTDVFKPAIKKPKDKFQFIMVGRWEYRKATTEIIQTWLSVFKNNTDVELLLLVDNPFAEDKLTTQERLESLGLTNHNIKVINFLKKEEYVDILQQSDVFLSCSRSEGWYLPLIEAISCGLHCIYSDCSGQLDFARGNKVSTIPIIDKKFQGYIYEPSFLELEDSIYLPYYYWLYKDDIEIYDEEYSGVSKEYLNSLPTWKNAAQIAYNRLMDIEQKPSEIKYHFTNGAFLEVYGESHYKVDFYNKDSLEYTNIIKNTWARSNIKYFVPWTLIITDKITGKELFNHTLDLKNKNVFIVLNSKALGDNIAWFPAIEEFRLKHNCNIVCSTYWNNLFEDLYPEINFVIPGTVVNNLYAMYEIGWDYNGDKLDLYKHPKEVKDQPLQKTAFDILGLKYIETKPKIKSFPNISKKQKVALGIRGSTEAKYWNNPNGWQDVTDFLLKKGYEVIILSNEPDGLAGYTYPEGAIQFKPSGIYEVIEELSECCLFIGVGSGLTWLSWASEIPTICISGFSKAYTEPLSLYRIEAPDNVCSGCFNRYKINPLEGSWCPDHKNTNRQFECSKSITSEVVIEKIKEVLKLN